MFGKNKYMNNAKLQILLFLILFMPVFQTAYCQENFSFRAKLMYNNYQFKDLKQIQETDLIQLRERGIKISGVESFPSYWGTQFQVLYAIPLSDTKKLDFGLFYDFASSGARSHYVDYSGEIKIDYLVRAHTLGITTAGKIDLPWNFVLSPGISIPVTYVTLGVSSYQRLWSMEQKDNIDLDNYTIGIIPGISLYYKLYRFLVGVSFEYQIIARQTGYTLKDNNDSKLYMPDNTPAESGLDGSKTGIILGINF